MLAWVVLAPLVGAVLALAAGGRLRVVRTVAAIALLGQLVAAVWLLVATADGSTVLLDVGGHGGVGIVLVGDTLAAVLLAVGTTVLTLVHLFALVQRDTDHGWPRFHAIYLALASGVALAFTTGDLFTLFVAFELTLIASYVLLTYGGRPSQVQAGMTYTVVNVTAGLLLLTAVALVYAATGTLDLATLAVRFPALPDGLQLLLGTLLLVPFAVKAAVFPLFSWLPDAYPTAPTPVTAVFAALLTKLGVYAIARTHTTLGLEELGPLLIVASVATMVVGVLGALAQRDIKRILSFHAVSQIGYLLFAVALFDRAGVTAAVVYLVHYILIKTALFLVAATIEDRYGTTRLSDLSGIARDAPGLAALFVLGSVSLAGLPPTSGFVAKLGVVQAGVAAEAWVGVGAALLVGVGTLLSMLKIWHGAFLGEAHVTPAGGATRSPAWAARTRSARVALGVPTTVLVAASVAVAVAAGPLVDVADTAAARLIGVTVDRDPGVAP